MHICNHFKQQVKDNLVAIISLVTALSGLMYDHWRDRHSELNQNMRNAAFEVLVDLAELQTIVNYAHFDADSMRGHPIEGWKYAIQIRDLSRLLPTKNMQSGEQLYFVWEKQWAYLQSNTQSEQAISRQIAKTRTEVISTIDMLK